MCVCVCLCADGLLPKSDRHDVKKKRFGENTIWLCDLHSFSPSCSLTSTFSREDLIPLSSSSFFSRSHFLIPCSLRRLSNASFLN